MILRTCDLDKIIPTLPTIRFFQTYGLLAICVANSFLILGCFRHDSSALNVNVDRPIHPGVGNDLGPTDFYDIIFPFPFSTYISIPDDLKDRINEGHSVLVDTNQIISGQLSGSFFGAKENLLINSYSVYFINDSPDPFTFGQRDYNHLGICQQAKDSAGNWVRIDARVPTCGVTYGNMTIGKNSFVVSKIPIYEGEYETELRVISYFGISDPFYGSVNLGQFLYD